MGRIYLSGRPLNVYTIDMGKNVMLPGTQYYCVFLFYSSQNPNHLQISHHRKITSINDVLNESPNIRIAIFQLDIKWVGGNPNDLITAVKEAEQNRILLLYHP